MISNPQTIFGRSAEIPLMTPIPGVSVPTSHNSALNLMDHRINLAAPTVLLISHLHWFCQPQNFPHCLSPEHISFVFVFQPNKATVKSLPYSKQAICEEAEDKVFPIIFLKDLDIYQRGRGIQNLCY